MRRRKGFTLVELLVVIGIIALLIAILMPALSKAQMQTKQVQCMANMRTVGQHLIMYANENRGMLVPLGERGRHLGAGVPRDQRWPTVVFRPPQWDHPVLRCPQDFEPAERHSYVLNIHLVENGIRFGTTKGVPPSEVIIAGEKKTEYTDYHMDVGQFDYLVEQFRHGLYIGSNYLYMDGHVNHALPTYARKGLDPWDPIPVEQKEPPPDYQPD